MKAAGVVLVSGHRFGAAALRGLVSSEELAAGSVEVVATLGLHPQHAIDTSGYEDLAPVAARMNLPFRRFKSMKSEQVLQFLKATPHDYLLVIGLSQLIPEAVLSIPAHHNSSTVPNAPSHGCVGMHPTRLPVGRGRAPIPWTILKGIRASGVTTFHLGLEADAGAVIDFEGYPVDSTESATSLFAKAERAHEVLGQRLAKLMSARNATSEPQKENEATVWPKRRPTDGWLDFSDEGRAIVRQVQALAAPYPPSFFVHGATVLAVHRAEVVRVRNKAVPGTILEAFPRLNFVIAVGDGAIRIEAAFLSGPRSSPKVGSVLATRKDRLLDAD